MRVYRYKLVKEALRERSYFLNTAPHLSNWLPIMVPVQKWWQAPYFWAGTKFYDFLAGIEGIESSYFLTKSKAVESFPMLRRVSGENGGKEECSVLSENSDQLLRRRKEEGKKEGRKKRWPREKGNVCGCGW